MIEPTATPLSFLDHVRASAAAPAPAPAIAAQKSKQISSAVERALLDCLGPGLSIELTGQQLVSSADWFSGLDAAAAVLAQPGEDGAGELALLALERRAVILMTTSQFGGASMLGLTDTGRPLTDIEQGFLAELGAALFACVRAPANSSAPPVQLLEPQAASALIQSDAMLTIFEFSILLGDIRLGFVLALAAGPAQADQGPAKKKAENTAWKSAVGSELTRSRVTLEAVVDLAALPLSRLRILLPGDIIPIPEGGLGRTSLVSRGETLLTGRLGKLAGAYTVRVTSAVCARPNPLRGAMSAAGAKTKLQSETR
jgi:hypothetical protein